LRSAVLLLIAAAAWPAAAQVDPLIAGVIDATKAIDNHAHPLKYVAPGQPRDEDYDQLPCDAMETGPGPSRSRIENPEWIGVWRALYGYKYQDATPEHIKELVAAKEAAKREHGADYPAWVLDKMGIGTMLANRVAMGPGLNTPRFRWVPFGDALLVPLNNDGGKRKNTDYKWFYEHAGILLKRYLADVHLSAAPESLAEYLAQVVTPTLERQKREGAVALKFEAAYLRPLDFEPVLESEASRIYAKFVRGGEPPESEYRTLQNYLFFYIAREEGRLGVAIHFHSMPGCGDYFNQRGANPMLMEAAFNDPALRKTNFVIIHGGWPYTKEVAGLFQHPNVYADFSLQDFFLYPRALAAVLRDWLEAYPEKVLFGTDASTGPPELDWEQSGYIAARTARQALAAALTGMVNDGEVTRERAAEIARMVLRENAVKLYGLK